MARRGRDDEAALSIHLLQRSGRPETDDSGSLTMTPMTTRLATIIVLLLALQTATASQGPSADRAANPGSLRQIIPGHYVFTQNTEGRLFNSGVVATSEGVVVFDALDSEVIARAELQAIAGVVKQPVRYLVSSVFH